MRERDVDQWLASDPPFRELCTDCGISRTDQPKRCGQVCQFIQPDYPKLERQVHGRERDLQKSDELHFGPFEAIHRARLREPAPGAQWTGIATGIAQRLLEVGEVDAVLAVRPDPQDRWRPQPVLVRRAEDMAQCRGMRMGYAPLLALLEPAIASGCRRLAVIGIPCQIYALRALEQELGLEKLFVIGTPCSDNTSTENFHQFLGLLAQQLKRTPAEINYLEFRPDYRVELRFDNGEATTVPFLALPISKLPADFFPLTCRSCVDYSNVLADITVGYMGGEGQQWLLVRNARGRAMLNLLGSQVELSEPGSGGKRQSSVRGFIANLERAAGGLPLRRMPNWLRPLVSWLMPRIGPRGMEFARARLEMKAAESVLHLRREQPKRLRSMVPAHVWRLVEPYDITPRDAERDEP